MASCTVQQVQYVAFATREACTVVPAVINRHKDNTKRHTQNSDVSSLIFIREMSVISIFIINERGVAPVKSSA